jgi:DNA (cytosine-5)-methyltransferase 1
MTMQSTLHIKPTVISLFSGIGGLDLAAEWAGFETIRFVEKEPFCQKVLAKHWPGVPIDDDVFTSHPAHADLVMGGFPCQPFSHAGERKGNEDERYLLPEMLRIVREVQPYAVLFENVSGFPTLNDGAEFKYLLRALAEMGFDAEWGNLRALDFGFPHERERWFLVAYANGIRQSRRWQSQNGAKSRTSGKESVGTFHCQASARLRQNKVGGRFERFGRFTQSRLGRIVNGLSYRLDKPQTPAFRGCPPYSYEPPRTTRGNGEATARTHTLGNTVVPQCAYPLFTALMDWFKELEAV